MYLTELKTSFHDCLPGRYKVAVKVVDIFGNDTMKIVDVSVGKEPPMNANKRESKNISVHLRVFAVNKGGS